jgi:mersacidin/lichenicidin family type 2 lantibiotic
MSHLDISRVLNTSQYRAGSSDTEQSNSPAHPAKLIELTGSELDAVSGGVTDGCIPRPGKPF